MKLFIVLTIIYVEIVAEDVSSAFTRSKIVPDSYENPPKELLEVNINGKLLTPGDLVLPFDVKDLPMFIWPANPEKYYTLIHVCIDYPTPAKPSWRNFLMLLIVNIPGNSIDKGETLSVYSSAAPNKGPVPSRAAMTVHEQPFGKKIVFNETFNGDRKLGNRLTWSINKFIEKYELSQPIWGNFYYTEYDDYAGIVMREFMAGKRLENLS